MNRKLIISLMVIGCFIFGQSGPLRPISTYSIVALDEETGQLGVAVQSHWFSVGFLVPWARAGVGAVATQSFVKVDYGPEGLELMAAGSTALEALAFLIEADSGRAVRQVGMVDAQGVVASYTGGNCIQYAGHVQGKNYTVQANLMASETVPRAMARAFENAAGDLADRMLAALEAAEREGGDIRGRQSAAMIIVSGKPSGVDWADKELDLRIEDHPEPLKELRRLIRIHRAYKHANQGDLYLELGEIEKAVSEYEKAAEFYPENAELPYWSAVALASVNRLNEALPIFKDVFARDPDLKTLTPRLVKAGLLPNDEKMLEKIMVQ
ncbi:MAG: DUF1028 domain-containing protein [Candidatus Neomarinimicrobiota bacterium]